MSKSGKKFITLLLGVIFLFCVSELFLRAFYFFQNTTETTAADKKNENNKFSILFLGNSHTFGAGVKKEHAYPGVLQKFFDQNLKNTSLQVVVHNGGVPNVNTYEIYNSLDEVVSQTKPSLAFIMAGEPNIWNKSGYYEYALQKNETPNNIFYNLLIKASIFSKTIRWVISFRDLTRKNILSEDQEDDLLVYKEIASVEKNIYDRKQKSIESDRLKLALERFILKNEKNPPEEVWRAVLYALAILDFNAYGSPNQALDLVEKSIAFKPAIFDIYAYIFLKEIVQYAKIDLEYYSRAKSIFIRLKSNPNYPGEERVQEILNYAIFGNRVGDQRTGLDYEITYESYKLFKILTVVTQELVNYQRNRVAKYSEANMALIETFKANPFSFKGNLQSEILDMASEKNIDEKSRLAARDIIEQFSARFPTYKYYFDRDQNENQTLFNWIRWDTVRIIKKMNQFNVPLVVQNYHWIRDRAEANTVNEAAESAAKEQQALFLDTHGSFMKFIDSEPADTESFFVQKFGFKDSHPSEKGHRYIAYIIYKYMVENKLLPQELSEFDPEQILKIN